MTEWIVYVVLSFIGGFLVGAWFTTNLYKIGQEVINVIRSREK